jgi:ATP-dependent helicase/nuclease subunit B
MSIADDTVSLLLVPDASAGRKVRRAIAERKLGLGLRVVTWLELIEEVRSAYLISLPSQDWVETIREAMEQFGQGYWNKSFEVDPAGTANVISGALDECIRAAGVGSEWVHGKLSERAAGVLSDLHDLWGHVDKALPPELELIETVCNDPQRAIREFAVYSIEGWPLLDSRQSNLIELLNDRQPVLNEDLYSILRSAASRPNDLPEAAAVYKIASQCFSGKAGVLSVSDDIAFLLARDPLQETECAAGILNLMLDDGMEPQEIGVLVPDDPYYHRALADVFDAPGILTAGLPSQVTLRDLAGEVVRSLILLARGPAPKMALASLCASPIAPWSRDIGQSLASNIMAGRFEFKSPEGISEDDEKSLNLIRLLRVGKVSISAVIEAIAQKLDGDIHQTRLRALAKTIGNHIVPDVSVDYDALLQLIGHDRPVMEALLRFPENGIRIFREGQEPWTEVKHLIVLGFNSGRYPALPGASPVLHDMEKQEINTHLDWQLTTSEQLLKMRRERFQRQIAATTSSIKFLASARNIDGSTIQLAETSTFMALLFNQELDDLFVPIAEDEKWLPRDPDGIANELWRPEPSDLKLNRDLIAIVAGETGELRAESPTSLETLLVSPLAWLLRRIGAEPDPWEPDKMDPLVQGNIAHSVFEELFPKEGSGLDRETVVVSVEEALSNAIRKHAPLLATAQWKVERHELRGTLIRAATWWQDVLEHLGGRVVGVEAKLTGDFNGVAIRGYCDQIIQLPDGKLIVVDFKKSSSPKRRERMALGYDCQVSLYEIMLGEEGHGLEIEAASGRPGIVYYTMNDQRVLADDRTDLPPDLPGLTVVANDVSGYALQEIANRMKELRRGNIEMNREGDAKRLDKDKGLPPYALENSPLIMMFAHPSSEEEAK